MGKRNLFYLLFGATTGGGSAAEVTPLNVSPSTQQQTFQASSGGYSPVNVEAVTADIDANIKPTNIRAGVTVLGVEGNLEPDKPDQTKTVTPSAVEQKVVADTGYELAEVTVEATPLQEKTITPSSSEQTATPDEGYVGLSVVRIQAAPEKTISDLDLSYGEQSVTYDNTDGMTVTGQAKITYSDNSADEATMEMEIPLKPGSGVNMDASSDGKSVNVGLDKTKTVLMPTTPASGNNVPIFLGGQNTWMTQPATPSATASSLVARDANGRAQFGTPQNDADAANKAYVDSAIEGEGPASTIVEISAPSGATQGTLTDAQLAILQGSKNASLMLDHKKYYLQGDGDPEGYLTYTHAGHENNVHILESITVTISTKAWVLNSTRLYNMQVMTQAVYDSLETKDDYTLYLIKG